MATRNIVVTRIIDAPIEEVWNAWTNPEAVMQWWGPDDFSCPSAKIDLKVGGKYVFCMRAPAFMGGGDSYTAGTYSKIEPNKLLEFTQGLSDAEGNPIDPASAGMPADFPEEIRTVVELEEIKGMTKLTITEYDHQMSQMFVLAYAGLNQTVDKMIASL